MFELVKLFLGQNVSLVYICDIGYRDEISRYNSRYMFERIVTSFVPLQLFKLKSVSYHV